MSISDASFAQATPADTRLFSTATLSAVWNAAVTNTTPTASRPVAGAPDFVALYETWFDTVLRWAAGMGVRNADKYDVAQNVFVVVQRRLQGCDGRNVPAWLFTITARQARDYRRQLWNATYFKEAAEPVDKMPSSVETPAMLFEQWERSDLLRELLARLSPEMRNALLLHKAHGFSCEEIAAMQGVPCNTVRSRLSRARKRLAQLAAQAELHQRTRRGRADSVSSIGCSAA